MSNNPVENIMQNNSDAQILKSRLQWGEPAFTIIDVRDRQTYNQAHITGALPMTIDYLRNTAAQTLAKSRNIYIYGASDADTFQAAQILKGQGFENVSELKGGLSTWKAIGGATEGIIE